ncbi:Protein LSD1 [Acorus calamus]|uniref:Protein LSD1 n=1 Tax=Acorus calamus TaxID=4465 RepID=A0AAV9FIA9_ACOCL|nr:Protein LSD1 [Acorus calamus]
MQSQLVCAGCRRILLYPRGATNVCCAVCNTVTGVPTARLVCAGCRTLLMYTEGASSVRCSCCQTINLARPGQVNCGNCHTTLMYPYGAPSVKCAICHYVTNIEMSNTGVSSPVNRPNGVVSTPPSTSAPSLNARSQTVVVENPMSVDESGKLVSNVVVGVTTKK